MAKAKKYKLIWMDGVFPGVGFGNIYRIKALRDIPLHGVKKGALGGHISSSSVLSQEGDCWVGYDAAVWGRVHISGDAYVGGRTRVSNAGRKKKTAGYNQTFIEGNAKISGSAYLRDVGRVSGNAEISGVAKLIGVCEVSGNSKVGGASMLSRGSKVLGNSDLTLYSKVFLGAVIENNKLIRGAAVIQDSNDYKQALLTAEPVKAIEAKPVSKSPKVTTINNEDNATGNSPINDAIELLKEVTSELHAYESDIVKVLTYPAMQDSTDAYTVAMMQALKRSRRLAKTPAHPEFVSSVYDLEKKFMEAESNALKLATSLLSGEELKKMDKAQDLMAIASNDASTEHEKKVSFQQAFKQLEGIIIVPDAAKETFRVKIGLKELETLTAGVNNV